MGVGHTFYSALLKSHDSVGGNGDVPVKKPGSIGVLYIYSKPHTVKTDGIGQYQGRPFMWERLLACRHRLASDAFVAVSRKQQPMLFRSFDSPTDPANRRTRSVPAITVRVPALKSEEFPEHSELLIQFCESFAFWIVLIVQRWMARDEIHTAHETPQFPLERHAFAFFHKEMVQRLDGARRI